MTDNVRKVFDILGVEPDEEFEIMLKDNSKFAYKFKLDENLQGYCFRDTWRFEEDLLRILLNGTYKIIKLPKEPKKKLRDLTPEEWDKWLSKNCTRMNSCSECIFRNVRCREYSNNCSWIYNKDIYSSEFLNQEIEVEE